MATTGSPLRVRDLYYFRANLEKLADPTRFTNKKMISSNLKLTFTINSLLTTE
jgi:hypothetical protein